MKTVNLVIKCEWALVKLIVDEKTAVVPWTTVHDDPEQAGDVSVVGPKIPGQPDQYAWVLEIAKSKTSATNLNILLINWSLQLKHETE